MRRICALALGIVVATGCGAAAKPLASGAADVTPDVAQAYTASRTAWFVCFGGRYRQLPADVIVVSRYRRCSIVLTDDATHEMRYMSDLRLGSAANLAKVDPGALVQALVRWDVLHLVVRYRGDDDSDPAAPTVAQQVGCRGRGMHNDFDCPRDAVPLLLAHDRIAEVRVWNRFWVRWK